LIEAPGPYLKNRCNRREEVSAELLKYGVLLIDTPHSSSQEKGGIAMDSFQVLVVA
jgi:hypothetical protein